MAKLVLTVKLFIFYLYNALLYPMPKLLQIAMGDLTTRPPQWFLAILIPMVFVPDIAFVVSSDFRKWVKRGVENDDGKFSKSDLTDLKTLYLSLSFGRLCMFWVFFNIFYGTPIDFKVFSLMAAISLGVATFPMLKQFLSKPSK